MAGVALDSIEKAWSYLRECQLPEGRFPEFVANGPDFNSPTYPERSVFTTCAILVALAEYQLPEKEQLADRALDFLESAMGAYESWTFWDSHHPMAEVIPTDLDDTALASWLLRHFKRSRPNNFPWMLANRRRDGAFYTWVGPRWNPWAPSSWWRLMLRPFRKPFTWWRFWSKGSAGLSDIDSVVNANVLFYFAASGRADELLGCAQYLKRMVEARQEPGSDKWYHGLWPLYYSLARAYRYGARELASVRLISQTQILAHQDSHGRFGESILDTAQAISALRFWNYSGPEIDAGRRYLIQQQDVNGSWLREPFFFGGPRRRWCWGSESLTTALCLEALLA